MKHLPISENNAKPFNSQIQATSLSISETSAVFSYVKFPSRISPPTVRSADLGDFNCLVYAWRRIASTPTDGTRGFFSSPLVLSSVDGMWRSSQMHMGACCPHGTDSKPSCIWESKSWKVVSPSKGCAKWVGVLSQLIRGQLTKPSSTIFTRVGGSPERLLSGHLWLIRCFSCGSVRKLAF